MKAKVEDCADIVSQVEDHFDRNIVENVVNNFDVIILIITIDGDDDNFDDGDDIESILLMTYQ